MAKMYPKKLKRHAFIDCTAIPYYYDEQKRFAAVVNDVRLVSCGQCRGRILDKIRAMDWLSLDVSIVSIISQIIESIRRENEKRRVPNGE